MGGLRELLRGCEKTHLGKHPLIFTTRHRDVSLDEHRNIHIEYCVKREFAQGKYKITSTELLIRQEFHGKEGNWAKYVHGKLVNFDEQNNHEPINEEVLDYLRKKHLPDYIQKQIPKVNEGGKK